MADLWDVHRNQEFQVNGLNLGGTLVTATAAELNASTAGLTATAAQINDVADVNNRAVTATSGGLTTGLLTLTDNFITVTSANADHIVTLPTVAAADIGKVIRGQNGATAFEMRTPSAGTQTINGGDAHSNESVVAANAFLIATVVSATGWSLITQVGATIAAPVPD